MMSDSDEAMGMDPPNHPDYNKSREGRTHWKKARKALYNAATKLLWTVRFVDYFAVLGHTAPTLESIRDSRAPDDLEIEPHLLDSVPREPEHPDMPLPPELATFCCPNGMRLCTKDAPGGIPKPSHFAQVLAVGTVGTTVYCCCVTFYDPMDPDELVSTFTRRRARASSVTSNASNASNASNESNDFSTKPTNPHSTSPPLPPMQQYPSWLDIHDVSNNPIVYAPKTLVILSHWPFLSVFRKFLSQTLRLQRQTTRLLDRYHTPLTSLLPIERYISSFVFDVPLPPRGRTKVQFSIAEKALSIQRPPSYSLPLCDLPIKPLFQCLSLQNIFTILAYLLTERSIAVCSKHASLLAPILEALRLLIFPLHWQCTYIPVLPRKWFEFLYAPVPFLMGLNVDFQSDEAKELHRMDGELIVFVDVDHNEILVPRNDPKPPRLPEQLKKKLVSRLKKVMSIDNVFNPQDLQDCDYIFATSFEPSASATSRLHRKGSSSRSNRSSVASMVSLAKESINKEEMKNYNEDHLGPMLTEESLTKSHVIRGSSTYKNNNRSMEETSTFSSSGVREAFVQFFVSLLSCYRHCYTQDENPEEPAPMGKFKVIENQTWDKKQFVHEQSRSYQAGRDARDFLSLILETQLFEDFVRTHTPREDAPSEIRLFDEYVVLFRGTLSRSYRKKIEKSRELGHQSLTPLLDLRNNGTPTHDETYVVPPPSLDGLAEWRETLLRRKSKSTAGNIPEKTSWGIFPDEMCTEWFGPIRPHEYLVEPGSSVHYKRMRQVMNSVRTKQTLRHHLVRKRRDSDERARERDRQQQQQQLQQSSTDISSPTNTNDGATTASATNTSGVISRRSPLTSIDAMDPTHAAAVLVGVGPPPRHVSHHAALAETNTAYNVNLLNASKSLKTMNSVGNNYNSSTTINTNTSNSSSSIRGAHALLVYVNEIVNEIVVTARLEGSRRVMLRAEQRIRDLEIMLQRSKEQSVRVEEKYSQIALEKDCIIDDMIKEKDGMLHRLENEQKRKEESDVERSREDMEQEQERLRIMEDAKSILGDVVVAPISEAREIDDDDEVKQEKKVNRSDNNNGEVVEEEEEEALTDDDHEENTEEVEDAEAAAENLLGTGTRRVSVNVQKWRESILPNVVTGAVTMIENEEEDALMLKKNSIQHDFIDPLVSLSELFCIPLKDDNNNNNNNNNNNHNGIKHIFEAIFPYLNAIDTTRVCYLISNQHRRTFLKNKIMLVNIVHLKKCQECRTAIGLPTRRRGLLWSTSVHNDVEAYSTLNTGAMSLESPLSSLHCGSNESQEPHEWFHDFMKDVDYLTQARGNTDRVLLTSMSVKSIILCYVKYDHEVGYCQGKCFLCFFAVVVNHVQSIASKYCRQYCISPFSNFFCFCF